MYCTIPRLLQAYLGTVVGCRRGVGIGLARGDMDFSARGGGITLCSKRGEVEG